ncbi:MAG TPA: hypothetical protein PK052_07160 [Anaerohalosphaeraceae bacterium]|nr:hypothetical protein [Phycisphaerae bacterium]HOK95398.1 hypothetical protein [Anaerohalosphaeraceae bacterium]HOL31747.1 hypothetical protein [Anaerohalosphaeraceae bacterium]HOM75475.1 hypothetical protein [Anaerohalosphaeraceae bacterium]HPC63797.1 hypothetical protein [Anaerohalosphaeraceae bacterium]
MKTQTNNPVEVLQQGLTGRRPVDEQVLSCAALLAERLQQLKSADPIFDSIAFSPDVEAMMASHLTAVVN